MRERASEHPAGVSSLAGRSRSPTWCGLPTLAAHVPQDLVPHDSPDHDGRTFGLGLPPESPPKGSLVALSRDAGSTLGPPPPPSTTPLGGLCNDFRNWMLTSQRALYPQLCAPPTGGLHHHPCMCFPTWLLSVNPTPFDALSASNAPTSPSRMTGSTTPGTSRCMSQFPLGCGITEIRGCFSDCGAEQEDTPTLVQPQPNGVRFNGKYSGC